MRHLGIDIGTTTITVLVSENNKIIASKTINNQFISSNFSYAMEQDAKKIKDDVKNLVDSFFNEYADITTIGVTGQMHGIVYVDKDFNNLSPLFTWCDQRGALIIDKVKKLTNEDIKVGYGLLTHTYNVENNLIPTSAYKILTIHDYIANFLANNSNFIIHASDAASLGFYDLKENKFKVEKLKLLGINETNLPLVTTNKECLGTYKNAKVYVAIGDNQASFLGATNNQNALLINFGTGAQISLKTSTLVNTNKEIELRPYLNNDYLLVGASLCGGKAFEALAKLFSEISNKSLDETYSDLVNIKYKETSLEVDTSFLGTRVDETKKGSITNISLANFNKDELVIATLKGMVNELYNYYLKMNQGFKIFIGSGNGIRKNKLLKEIIERKWGQDLLLTPIKEEACFGASIYPLI